MVWVYLGGSKGGLGRVLGQSWEGLEGVLGGLGGVLGGDLGPFWGILGPPGSIREPLGDISVPFLLGSYFVINFLRFYQDFSIRRTREKRFWYYANRSFEPSRSFHIKLGQDAVLVPKYIHMASQNAPKSGLGGVLEPSWRPLGPSWKHHEAFRGDLRASRTYFGASLAILEASWGSKIHGIR